MWHLVSRWLRPHDCRNPNPIVAVIVEYIRTWLDVVVNATTCRRSGPTQEASLGLSKAGEVTSTWQYFVDPCKTRVGLVQRRRHGLRLPSHVEKSTATSCTSPFPFHSTRLTHSLAHSHLRPAQVGSLCCPRTWLT